MHKALFLDRDGIVNVDKGYVFQLSEIVWVPETFEMIKLAIDKGYKVIILTNQSGICKGMYTKADVDLLHGQMDSYLKSKNLHITDWFYCQDMDSEDRKPRPGMLLAAHKKHQIDLGSSFMVGDKMTDVFETDNQFVRPMTFLVRGDYQLKELDQSARVKIFENHCDVLAELKKVL